MIKKLLSIWKAIKSKFSFKHALVDFIRVSSFLLGNLGPTRQPPLGPQGLTPEEVLLRGIQDNHRRKFRSWIQNMQRSMPEYRERSNSRLLPRLVLNPPPVSHQACPKVSNPVVLWVSSQWGPREHSAHHRLPRLSTKEMKLHPRAPLQQPIKRELVDQRDPPSQAPHQPQTPQAGKKHQTMKCATFGSTIRTRATGGRTPLISKSGWSLNIWSASVKEASLLTWERARKE